MATAFSDNRDISIVIADDDATARLLLKILLEEQRYTLVGEAENGMEAVNLCVRHKPHIAFIDIQMPKMDGHEVTYQIRQRSPHTAIIIVSGLATPGNVRQSLQTGAHGFVVKPFNPDKLIATIGHCIKLIR